ncbi:MAG: recombinase family protein [Clostridiaceae bacterium]|nr:recombinase family protein [Clostridiaceae bacterium]
MYTTISNPMDYKTAFYIRLSKEDDKDTESQSVTNQRSLLSEFAVKNRLDVFDIYIDDGWSGTSFERPDFQRMIADIENKKVNLVLTKDMSRLGRDYIQTGYYLEKFFPSHGVRYISLLDGVDTGIDSGINDITPFKAIMNDMYAKDISKKITSVKREKQRKGLFIGGKAAYGYKISAKRKNVIEIDEPAAEVVRKIFGLAIEGKSCREIAVTLNNGGVPTPAQYAGINLSKTSVYSGKWSAERIAFMLKNEVYIGNMVQGRIRKINYKLKQIRKVPPEEWIVVENTHPPVVQREVFDKVQLLIASRNHTRKRTHDFLLKGLIFCHECGYPLGVIQRSLAGDKQVLYFVCRTYQRFTKERKCTCHCVRVDDVTEWVTEKIKSLCAEYLDKSKCVDIASAAAKKAIETRDPKEQINQVESRAASLSAHLDSVYNDKLAGVLDEDDFARIYAKIKQERQALQERLKTLTREKEKDSAPQIDLESLMKTFIDTADRNKEMLVSLIERIELSEQKEITIRFRFQEPSETSVIYLQ